MLRNLARPVIASRCAVPVSRFCTSNVVLKEASDDITNSTAVQVLADDSNEIGFYRNTKIGRMSGIPEEHIKNRRVRIYSPAKCAAQSGEYSMGSWKIEYETRERWENPCMGWTSTGDPLSNLLITFATKEDAIRYAENMGYNYTVEPEPVKYFRSANKTYGANFSWNKRTRTNTK